MRPLPCRVYHLVAPEQSPHVRHIITQIRIHTKEHVSWARMVPIGMDLCGSFRSPDMLDPVMIPGTPQIRYNSYSCCAHVAWYHSYVSTSYLASHFSYGQFIGIWALHNNKIDFYWNIMNICFWNICTMITDLMVHQKYCVQGHQFPYDCVHGVLQWIDDSCEHSPVTDGK